MSRRPAGRAVALAVRTAPGHLAGYLVVAVSGGLTPLALAWLTKVVLDRLSAGTVPWPDMIMLVTALGLIGVLAAALPHAARYLRSETERRVNLAATERLFAAVGRFVGLRRFEDPAFLDELQIARSSGVSSPGFIVDAGVGIVRAMITVTGFASVLLLLGPLIALLVLLSAVPAILAEIALSRRRAAMIVRTGHATRREVFYAGLLTDPDAAKEVRLFGAGSYLWRRMAKEMRTINGAQRRIARREVAVQSALAVLSALVAGALLLWAVRAAAAGAITIGDVALVVAAVGAVQAALSSLITETITAHQSVLLFRHYIAVVDAAPDLPVAADPRLLPPLRRGIELRDVWFRYDDAQSWVLRGVSVTLPFGRTTALVGLNGAGKTTVIKLLCRLYDPVQGAVLWDGVDLRDVDPVQLRSRIRAVFQDATAYDLTATENIAIGDLSALGDVARISGAAATAEVHEVLTALPHGYETMLTRMFFPDTDQDDARNGVLLSGGQWQRLAIARGVLLERPDLLILDEPSSALDAQAEHDVHTRLREHRRGLTTLLISHRLGVVREADHIIVLSDGVVAEQGTHDSLLRANGSYARLFRLQASGYRHQSAEIVP